MTKDDCIISFGEHGIIVLKVKVEDLKGLLTQKHGLIVMKEDPKGLGGSLNTQEYLLLICYTLQIGYKHFWLLPTLKTLTFSGQTEANLAGDKKSVDLIQLSTPKKLAI